MQDQTSPPPRRRAVIVFSLVVVSGVGLSSVMPRADASSPLSAFWGPLVLGSSPSKVVGTKGANCKQCHPSEVAAWEKTAHHVSTRRLEDQPNTLKYAAALGVPTESLQKNSVCAECHGTKSGAGADVKIVSGVSCESCHGPAKDWLKPHGMYADDFKFESLAQLREARTRETDEHRKQRLEMCAQAGMIRPAALYDLAKNCLECHMVGNEKLVAAGHKAASAFELASWSSGEIRHNFFMNADVNAKAPTLWMERQGKTAEERQRVKFVLGALVQLEAALRNRAKARSPAYIGQVGGLAAAAHGRLSQINAMAQTHEVKASADLMTPMLGTIFIPQAGDEKTYLEAADTVAEQAKAFLKNHDGSDLGALDSVIAALPARYSQHYKKP